MAADRAWEAIGYRLINGTAVFALVSTIWLGEKPTPEYGWPAINFFPVPGSQLLEPRGAVTSALYQVSCRATDAAAVLEIARAVELDWQNFYGTIDGGFDVGRASAQVEGLIWEPDDEVYHVPVTLRIVYTSSEG